MSDVTHIFSPTCQVKRDPKSGGFYAELSWFDCYTNSVDEDTGDDLYPHDEAEPAADALDRHLELIRALLREHGNHPLAVAVRPFFERT